LQKNEFVFGKYVDYKELVTNLERVSIDEVIETANDTFRKSKVSFVALGPIKDENFDRGLLEY